MLEEHFQTHLNKSAGCRLGQNPKFNLSISLYLPVYRYTDARVDNVTSDMLLLLWSKKDINLLAVFLYFVMLSLDDKVSIPTILLAEVALRIIL